MSPRSVAAVAAASVALGCEPTRPGQRTSLDAAAVDAPSEAGECVPRVAQKLGVDFLRICPSVVPGATPRSPEFWISLTPIGCAPGSHDTVRCPPVLALSQPRLEDPPSVKTASTMLAAVVEADTAHKVCTMRFAGRLPTIEERSLMRESLGVATVLAKDSRDGRGIELSELAEWVTRRPCDHPTMLDVDCGVRGFPWTASPAIPWASVTRCEASPLVSTAGRALIGVDGTCPGRPPECALVGPAADARGRRVPALSLACGGTVTAPLHAPAEQMAQVAAFRCVLDAWL